MEFDINVKTHLNGNIVIEDYSNEYDQYLPENQIIQQPEYYKYSECKTLNILIKINTDKITLMDVLLHEHDQLVTDPVEPEKQIYDLEKTHISLKGDGYYNIYHIVLPTKEWYINTYLQQDVEYQNYYEYIYIIGDDNKIYKYCDNNFEECSVKEIMERNILNTTIEKKVIEVFYTGFLQMCYINYCKKLFQQLTKNCKHNCTPKDNKDLIYIRDFLWMVLNVINYQIEYKQYMEAQRILEMTNGCGSFCKNQELNSGPYVECGCS